MAIPLRVLIVEDSSTDAELMVLQITKEGFQPDWQRVETESDFLKALGTDPDLILADWHMPKFSAPRAMELINERDLDIPFIIVSGSIGEETAIDALRQGADDYVLKDRPARLGSAVRDALEGKRLRQEGKRAEEALRQSEEKYRNLIDGMNETVWVIDFNGNLVDVNKTAVDVLGYSKEELLSVGLYGIDSSLRKEDIISLAKSMPRDETQIFETSHTTKDGRTFPVEVVSSLINYQGKQAILSIARDITERKQTEETIRDLARFPAEDPNPVLRIAQDGSLLYGNQAAFDLLKEWKLKVGKPAPEILRSQADKVLETRKDARLDIPCGDRIFSVAIAPAPQGADVNLYARDITDRKRLEEKLAKEQQELRLIIDTSPIIIFYKDKEGRFIRVNKVFAEALKMSAEDFVEKTNFDLYPPEIAQGMTDDDQEVIRSGHAIFNIVEQYVSVSGVRWVQTDKIPIFDEDGNPAGLIGFAQDITDRKKAEEALSLRMEQLVAINQASQAVATSLDLDQVLTEVMSLAGKVVDSEYTSFVLVDESGHLSRGVENMPDMLSIERRARKRGFTSWILRTQQPAVVEEIGEDGVIRPRVGEGAPRTANPDLVAKGIKSFVGLPLMVKDHILGVLYVHSLHPGVFSDQLPLLTTFAYQAAIALEKARLYEEVQKELTERKQAEEVARQSAERFKTLFMSMGDGFYLSEIIYDDSGNPCDYRYLEVNPKFEQIMGLSRDQIVGKRYKELVPVDTSQWLDIYLKVARNGEPLKYEFYSNEYHKYFETYSYQPTKGQVTVIVSDITERKQAEEALHKSEELLQSSIRIADIGIFDHDQRTDTIYWSPRQREIHGWGLEEPVNLQTFFSLVHPEDLDRIVSSVKRAHDPAGDGLWDVEHRIIRRDGTLRWLAARSQTFFEGEGQTRHSVRTVGAVLDITERKQAEAELRASREAERNFAERLTVLSETTTELSKTESLDALCRRAVELGRERLDFDRPSVWFVTEDCTAILGTFGVDAEGQITDERGDSYPVTSGFDTWPVLQGQVPLLRLTDGPLWLKGQVVGQGTHVVAGLWDGNTVIGYVSVDNQLRHRPFSDQDCEIIRLYASAVGHLISIKRAEDRLHGSEERYRLLFELSPDSIAVYQDGKVVFANPAAVNLIGATTPEEFIGKPVMDFVHPDYRKLVIERSRQMMTDGGIVPALEEKFLCLDGTAIDVEVTAAPVNYQNKSSTMVIFRDITERKRAEDELRDGREAERNFAERLTILSEITTELSQAESLDMLCRRAVELGQERLDFDRLAIWFIAEDRTTMLGTFGVDAEGRITDERTDTHPLTSESEFWPVIQGQVTVLHLTDLPLYLNQQIVGQGAHVCAGLSDGNVIFGYMSYDNLLRQRPFSDRDCEIIRLYASAVGHLISLQRAKKEIHASEERFEKSFQSNPIATIINILPEGRMLDVNDAFLRITGYSREEVIGKTGLEVSLWADPEDRIRLARALIEQESLRDVEGRLLTKSGESRDMLASVETIQIADQPHGLIMLNDITERKRAEEMLAQERNLLRSLIDNVPDYIYVKDNQSRFMVANTALAHLVGSSKPDDLLGKTDFDFFPKELAAKYYADDRGLFQSGQALLECEETTIDNTTGSPRWISTNKVPLRDAQGNIFGMVGIGRDISERKRAEEALGAERNLLRTLIDNLPDAIYAKDRRGRKTLVNRADLDNIGKPEAEVLGKTDAEIFSPQIAAQFEADDHRVLQSGQPVLNHEEQLVNDKGKQIWQLTSKLPLKDAAGQVVGMVGIGHDITERKQTEEKLAAQAKELLQRNEELARLYRASGSLISGGALRFQDLAQKIVDVVQQEFGQAVCCLLVVEKDSDKVVPLVCSGVYAEKVGYEDLTLNGSGLISLAIRTDKVVNVGDVHSAPDYVQGWDAAQSEMVIPLKVGNDTIGAIDMQSSQTNAFSPDDERLMTIFAERAALSLEHGRLNEQTETRLQQLTALRTVDMAISGSFDINLTLGILLDQLIEQVGVHAADVLVFNAGMQTFEFTSERGFRMQMLQRTQFKFGAGYAWRAIRERRVVNIPDINVGPDGLQRSPDLSSEQFVAYLGLPLVAKGEIQGVLEVFHREPLVLEKDLYGFLEMLAGQAAIAINNAELFSRLQTSNADLTMAYDATLEGWASALELRDKETEGHTRRVTETTMQLAKAMGVKENELVHIYRGAVLHDIGKMGVPDHIMLKPGPLTEDEWVIMRKHPQYAYDMISHISFLRNATDIPYCHHEKWDGTGYPRGLKGVQIPLAARIFSVVDVWDALTSDRPYRKAWTEAKTLQYIQDQEGLYFDPQVVQTFLKESFKK